MNITKNEGYEVFDEIDLEPLEEDPLSQPDIKEMLAAIAEIEEKEDRKKIERLAKLSARKPADPEVKTTSRLDGADAQQLLEELKKLEELELKNREIAQKQSKQTKKLHSLDNSSPEVEIDISKLHSPVQPNELILPAKFNPMKLIAVASFTLILIMTIGIPLSRHSSSVKADVRLLYPADKEYLGQNELRLKWEGTGDIYLVQVEEDGKKIIERLVTDSQYSFSSQERRLLKPLHIYSWRVIPRKFNGQQLPSKTEDFKFTIKYR